MANPLGRPCLSPKGKMKIFSLYMLPGDIERIHKWGGQGFLRELILDELEYLDKEEGNDNGSKCESKRTELHH